MSGKKFFWIALFIGAQACVLQIIDQSLSPVMHPAGNSGFGWIAFQSWATYFLAGLNVKGGIKSCIGYFIGIIASIAILILSGGIFANLGFMATPIVLLILVPCLIFLELGPDISSMVPAVFIGSGAFFGFMTYVPGATFAGAATTEMIYCIIGLIFGFMTITFRGWYEGKYVKTT